MTREVNRRDFIAATATAGAGLALLGTSQGRAFQGTGAKPAILGGTPVRTEGYYPWPVPTAEDEEAVLNVVKSASWYRAESVRRFEEEYAALNNAKYCVATSSGTTALFSSLGALGVGPGDEVIVPPYTFLATVSVVLLHHALPVFVDTDRETFLMNPAKLEAAITERTKAIIPVHIGGSVADLDSILAIAKKHNVPVIEDACQAHLAQWRNRGVGSWGTSGCFSFQLSKNLCSGEGGAIISNDEPMINNCFAFHNCGRGREDSSYDFNYELGRNTNARMTEFQAALLSSRMTSIAERAQTRSDNADYLSSMISQIPGITPARMYEGCTRNAYHIYMFRYQPEAFANLPRQKFLRALIAEGIPCSGGYGPLNKDAFIQNALKTRPYVKVYGKPTIDKWLERNECPDNDKLCGEALWFMQNMLIGPRTDMEQIAEAIGRIQKYAGEIGKA